MLLFVDEGQPLLLGAVERNSPCLDLERGECDPAHTYSEGEEKTSVCCQREQGRGGSKARQGEGEVGREEVGEGEEEGGAASQRVGVSEKKGEEEKNKAHQEWRYSWRSRVCSGRGGSSSSCCSERSFCCARRAPRGGPTVVRETYGGGAEVGIDWRDDPPSVERKRASGNDSALGEGGVWGRAIAAGDIAENEQAKLQTRRGEEERSWTAREASMT